MSTSSELDRDPLELLFTEYLERTRAGEAIALEDFAARHPELAEEICDLFPTMISLEEARASRVQPTSSHEFTAMTSSIGGPLRLGDYELLREIGAGGMGIVYEALQESMQRRVAVKVLPREFNRDKLRRQRFIQEARTVAKLSHRNIVPVIDFGEAQDRCYFTMQLIEGVSLDWVISQLAASPAPVYPSDIRLQFDHQGVPFNGTDASDEVDDDSLACEFNTIQKKDAEAARTAEKWHLKRDSWKQFARIGIQAAKALHNAHQAGILHRDIKPGNLLLDEGGIIWVTDFGLAKSEKELALTGSNDLVGTLRYIAPERFDGHFDVRSDVYALGITLMELVLQRHVFETESRAVLMKQIIAGRITAPRKINSSIPAGFERILLKATALDPDQRYASANALLQDLRAFSKGQAVTSARIEKPTKRTRRKRIRWNFTTGVLVAICVTQLALLAFLTYRVFQPASPGLGSITEVRKDLLDRVGALDAFYQPLFGRSLGDDLNRQDEIEPLSADDSRRDDLQQLAKLYRHTAAEAQHWGFREAQSDLDQRIRLITKLLGEQ